MNIYDLTGYALQLKELLDADEIDEQTFSDTLESIGADDKVDSYCMIIRELEAEIGARDEAAKHLAELKLTPAKRQAAAVEINDEFDAFPD